MPFPCLASVVPYHDRNYCGAPPARPVSYAKCTQSSSSRAEVEWHLFDSPIKQLLSFEIVGTKLEGLARWRDLDPVNVMLARKARLDGVKMLKALIHIRIEDTRQVIIVLGTNLCNKSAKSS